MCSIKIFILILLVETYKCKEAQTNRSVNDFLIDSRSRLNNWNKILPKLKEILPEKFNRSWSNLDSPFWLRMANQAQYLQYLQEKNRKISILKFELAKKIPFIKKITNQCLADPWSSVNLCKFNFLNRNIQLLCLVENLEPYQIENLFNLANSKTSELFSKYCWIIYAINYLEQCQINMLIDEDRCSPNDIELVIKLIIKKIDSNGLFDPFNDFFFKKFKTRSMQILTQILILLNNIKNNDIFGFSVNMMIADSEKFYEFKFNLEKLLNYLLNEYAIEKARIDLSFKLSNKHDRFKITSHIIDLKIANLVNFSLHIILKNLFKQNNRLMINRFYA